MWEPEVDYNAIQFHDSESQKKAKIDMWVAKALGNELIRVYPGRHWSVTVDQEAGTVVVQALEVSARRGFSLSLNRSLHELTSMMTSVGGEILERAGLSRSFVPDPEAVRNIPRDFRGEPTAPDMLAPGEIATKKAPKALH